MATDLSTLYDALRNADAAGDTEGAQRLAAYIKTQGHQSFDAVNGKLVPTGSPEAKAAQSPVSDSATQNFLAGAGKATVDIGRGIGQLGAGALDVVAPRSQTLSGLVTGKPQSRVDEWRQSVANSRERDTALMNTKAGIAGNITGNIADSLPAAFIPGAGTLAGAAGIGTGLGLLQPSESTGETLQNVGMGAAAGPGGLLLGRAGGALWQAGKSAIEPFLKGGPERIAARALQSFAGGPQEATAAVNSIKNAPQLLPGLQPTTAELANSPGLNQLERTLANNAETNPALTARNQSNQSAVTNAVRGIAGTDADMAAAQTARSSASQPLYEAARNATVPADAALGGLLARPSLKAAWTRAEELAAERGETLSAQNANDINGRTLQYLKMALQDTAAAGPQRGMGSHELGAVRSTLGDLQSWITKNVPSLRAADSAYATGSAPINQMEVGQALQNRLEPALSQFSQAPNRLNAASFANAVRNGDQIAANATGNARSTLAGTLTPDQMTTVNQVGEHLARRGAVNDVGRAVGSPTAQNLIGHNFMQQTIGPLGLPQNAIGRLGKTVADFALARPYQFVAKAVEPDVQHFLTQAALDPQAAARMLLQHPNSRIAQLLWAHQGLLGPVANVGAQGLLGSGNAPQQ